VPYASVDTLIADVASFYDDTNATTYTLPPSKINRYRHYIQRTIDDIYAYKAWPWKMAYKAIQFNVTPANGREAPVPADFANVGPNGALFDSVGEPWAEIDFRNMIAIITANRLGSRHYFCVGRRIESSSAGIGDGGVLEADARGLLIPDPNNTTTFMLFYETSPPLLPADGTDPVPIPEAMHHALLLGTVAKLQEGKADPRDIWRAEYIAALTKQVAALMPMASRVKQMPMSSGRRMW
jgi:hypothetical protein